jgi:hypothetical protein
MVKSIGAIVFIGAAFLTYGQSLLFEKIHLAVLGFIAVIFIRDINLISLICISAIANIVSELLYPLVMTLDFQITLKVLTYSTIILYLIKFREDSLHLSVSLVIAMCLGAELYWYVTGSPGAMIYWYALLININLLVRYFLFSRVFIMAKYFPKEYRSLNLDHTLYQVVLLYIVVHELVLMEYVLRWIFDVPSTLVYYAAPYLFHGLTAYTALLIYIQGYRLISKNWLKA